MPALRYAARSVRRNRSDEQAEEAADEHERRGQQAFEEALEPRQGDSASRAKSDIRGSPG